MINLNQTITYTIQQVANLTGLSKQVIRKWEERYDIIHPRRLDNGYRVYSHKEVTTLLRIQALMADGMTVKQAIAIVNQERVSLDTQSIFAQTNVNTKPQLEYAQQIINILLHEGMQVDDTHMLYVLQQAHHTLGVKTLIYDVIVPFLDEVGNRWCIGEWGEFQEALSSLIIRDFLANLRRNLHVQEEAPLILGSCLPNERHEIPLHILMLQSSLLGYRSLLLGPSPAPTAIQSTIKLTNPKIVLLSAITTLPFEDDYKMIDELDHFASNYPHIRFYLGGPGAMQALQNRPLRHIQLTSQIQQVFHELKG